MSNTLTPKCVLSKISMFLFSKKTPYSKRKRTAPFEKSGKVRAANSFSAVERDFEGVVEVRMEMGSMIVDVLLRGRQGYGRTAPRYRERSWITWPT